MRRTAALASLLIGCTFCALAPRQTHAQRWAIDLYAGRSVYEPVPAGANSDNLVAGVRYGAPGGPWAYGAAAAPLGSGNALWGALGAGGRLIHTGGASRRGLDVGLDYSAHGFFFRDAIVQSNGGGGTLEAVPFAGFSTGATRLELRGGWRQYALGFGGTTELRGVFDAGARVAYRAPLTLQADARWVRAHDGGYGYVGGFASWSALPVRVWAQAGSWVSGLLDDTGWGAGASIDVGGQTELWLAVRQDVPDPLYRNPARQSWNIGATRRLGTTRAQSVLPAPSIVDGRAVIRVPASEARGAELHIAGDFSGWQPLPMRREGNAWVIRLPLASGVYHYAFRSRSGEWFVPESIRAQRDDGMGGRVAILVVS